MEIGEPSGGSGAVGVTASGGEGGGADAFGAVVIGVLGHQGVVDDLGEGIDLIEEDVTLEGDLLVGIF